MKKRLIVGLLTGGLMAAMLPGLVSAEPAEVVKDDAASFMVWDGAGNWVNVDAKLRGVVTNSERGRVTMSFAWTLPDTAVLPERSIKTDEGDQGLICRSDAPYFQEVVTPSGRGHTICQNWKEEPVK